MTNTSALAISFFTICSPELDFISIANERLFAFCPRNAGAIPGLVSVETPRIWSPDSGASTLTT